MYVYFNNCYLVNDICIHVLEHKTGHTTIECSVVVSDILQLTDMKWRRLMVINPAVVTP